MAYVILRKIREWINLIGKSHKKRIQFKPLRLTVIGCAGTGKSVLINTLVACIRRMFKKNDSVLVAAPTGAAAHNIGGQTIHREFKIGIGKGNKWSISKKAKEYLHEKLEHTIAVFFDERSMISQRVLGNTEMNIRHTAHGGGHENEDWGGIPVVVLFGDDFQLTPPCEDGAIDAFSNQGHTEETKNGAYHFIKLGETTLELKQIIRQNEDQREFRDVLGNTRVGYPSEDNVETILSLHLNSGSFSMQEIEEIEGKALYIFANKKQMKEHNLERLKAQHSYENPVARLKAISTSKGKLLRNIPKCFKQDNQIEPVSNICRGAKVQLAGRNFEPDWGLYNGSIGTVKEIVFNKGESPLDGTLPQYVIVEFLEYCGPAWIKNQPKWVPIPPVEIQCQSHCCSVKFVPLSLAYAKTGHTFQGQSAGPGHSIPCIIIQPGSSKMEKLCPGLLYMFLSRGTTIGSPNCRARSSIFFISDELTKDRIKNLTTTKTGEQCIKIARRTKWVNFLEKNNLPVTISVDKKQELINWANETVITQDIVEKLLEDNSWHQSNSTNF